MSKLVHDTKGVGWVIDGYYHREHGPCRIYNNGSVHFSQTNSGSWVSRRQGPAIILADGYVSFRNVQGVPHRTTGPAFIQPNNTREYWVNGDRVLADEFFLKYGVL